MGRESRPFLYFLFDEVDFSTSFFYPYIFYIIYIEFFYFNKILLKNE